MLLSWVVVTTLQLVPDCTLLRDYLARCTDAPCPAWGNTRLAEMLNRRCAAALAGTEAVEELRLLDAALARPERLTAPLLAAHVVATPDLQVPPDPLDDADLEAVALLARIAQGAPLDEARSLAVFTDLAALERHAVLRAVPERFVPWLEHVAGDPAEPRPWQLAVYTAVCGRDDRPSTCVRVTHTRLARLAAEQTEARVKQQRRDAALHDAANRGGEIALKAAATTGVWLGAAGLFSVGLATRDTNFSGGWTIAITSLATGTLAYLLATPVFFDRFVTLRWVCAGLAALVGLPIGILSAQGTPETRVAVSGISLVLPAIAATAILW